MCMYICIYIYIHTYIHTHMAHFQLGSLRPSNNSMGLNIHLEGVCPAVARGSPK